MRRRSSTALFKLLGDPTRLVILERLARLPRTAGELARELPVSRSAVAQHLAVLKKAGLAEATSDGRKRIYKVVPSGLRPLHEWLERHTEGAAGFDKKNPPANRRES
jgi:DNA-binding transcriptional ArsR family regulator